MEELCEFTANMARYEELKEANQALKLQFSQRDEELQIASDRIAVLQEDQEILMAELSQEKFDQCHQTDPIPEPEAPVKPNYFDLDDNALVAASDIKDILNSSIEKDRAIDQLQMKLRSLVERYNDQADLVAELDRVASERLDQIIELRRAAGHVGLGKG